MQGSTKKTALTALFIALGVAIPQLFHLLPWGATMLLPMHIPVLLCGMVVGGPYGLICGVTTVALSMIITGMPPVFPVGVCMMAELAAYGLFAGLLYGWSRRALPSLIGAMLLGRAVFGAAMMAALGMSGKAYTLQAFVQGAFLTAVPGIVLQLLLIPVIVRGLERAKLVGAHRR